MILSHKYQQILALLVIIFGLLSALTWGIGDFSGGVATKKVNVIVVLIVSQVVGVITLFLLLQIIPEQFDWGIIIWPVIGGIFGGMGLLALYQGLAKGVISIVAPLSAVVASIITMIFAAITIQTPSNLQLAGFLLAIVSIFFMAQESKEKESKTNRSTSLLYGTFAGFGFGGFFLIVNKFSSVGVYTPLLILRISSITFFSIILFISRNKKGISGSRNRIKHNWKSISLAGIGDTFGNVFFALAAQNGRVDIAVIISSLFPLSTIFLAWIIYQEKTNHLQKLGIFGAIVTVLIFSI